MRILKGQKRTGPKFKHGIQVPRNLREARELDRINGNNLWEEAIKKEIDQLRQYEVFKKLPKGKSAPKGYTFVPLHITFDVKFDLRRKARMVAGGNFTDPGYEDVFSGVVSIDSVRIGFFLADLNNLEKCAADVGNAFLHGTTRELIYCIAGPEFGEEWEGCVLLVVKSLYGLRTSAARWHEFFTDTLRMLGFKPSYADPDLYMKDYGTHYEYICMYVDDILIFSKSPMTIVRGLEALYILKGVGEPEFYLGGNVSKAEINGKIRTVLSAKTYIKNCSEKIEKLFSTTLRQYGSPMDPLYHPETDTTELLGPEDVSKYRMLIGSGNWIVTLGRFDIHYAVGTLARYLAIPREGHLKAMLRVFGYLKTYNKRRLVINTDQPDYTKLESVRHNWTEFYPDAKENIPDNCPVPKGKEVIISTIFDASHASDLVTRRSVTGIVTLLNKTVIKTYCKRQNTVETSTYGSELIAARIATDITVEFMYKMRMLGVPIKEVSMVFGDNESVIKNVTLPSSTLKKKHNAIAYHRICEAVAAGYINLHHIPGTENIADVLTKPLGPQVHYRLIKDFLY